MTDGTTRSMSRSVSRSTLSSIVTRLREARREALEAIAVEETEWEYAGRQWSWPAGEEMTYFRELAPTERSVLDRATDEHGIEVVGVGTGRVAVALPDCEGETPPIVKLARYGPSAVMGDGRQQNRRERRVWAAVGEHPFLPVVDATAGDDWIAMPRATVPPQRADREDALRRVREALVPHRESFHFEELKLENVGFRDGRFWIVDYGRPPGEPPLVDPSGSDPLE